MAHRSVERCQSVAALAAARIDGVVADAADRSSDRLYPNGWK
jgi:hypothetical protein